MTQQATVACSDVGAANSYNVHLYALARVKVCNIPAASQSEAIAKAEAEVDMHQLLKQTMLDGPDDEAKAAPFQVAHVEWAEDNAYYLVDPRLPDGQTDYDNTGFWENYLSKLSIALPGTLEGFFSGFFNAVDQLSASGDAEALGKLRAIVTTLRAAAGTGDAKLMQQVDQLVTEARKPTLIASLPPAA